MLTGLILTNTLRLAEVLNESPEKISTTILRYIDRCASYINWQLVDLANMSADGIFNGDWKSCAMLLGDFYYGLGLNDRYNTPLFIIGGDNVVPMPTIENPLMMSVGRKYLQSDMLYCFNSTDEVHWEYLINEQPRFAVGRLPLPIQSKKNDINQRDLVTYLDACVNLTEDGINITGIAMETAESFYDASIQMMHDLSHSQNTILVSPPIDLSGSHFLQECSNVLSDNNFGIFCLHGSSSANEPYFVGENKLRNYYPIAIAPGLLSYHSPQIFNTIACHGARYVDYIVSESMLLTALGNGTMLYCGACDTAIGGVSELSNASALMSFYNVYLCQGYPAGMALIKAKQDFYRSCHLSSGDTFAMYTILEFNLFGCPILSACPQLNLQYRPMLYQPIMTGKSVITYNPEKITPLFKQIIKNQDMRSMIKISFDKKLGDLSKVVENELQKYLPLNSVFLEQVYKLTDSDHETGYRFVYTKPSDEATNVETKYFVNVDMNGTISPIQSII